MSLAAFSKLCACRYLSCVNNINNKNYAYQLMMSYVRGVSVVYSCVLKKCKCNAKDVTLHDSIVYWIARNKQDDSAILS